ncbi:MAG: hypothetical protein JWL86_4975 [Rhizobium sp.]|nr:hypothetical protein [Rhizobium sp.]
MDFKLVRPDAVRAINQRWLLKFWNRHVGTGEIPPWQAVEAENLTRVSDNLSFLDVTGDGEIKRFRIRPHGSGVAKVYGAPDCRGRCLDEVIPRARHPTGLMPYYRAYSTGPPVYTICDLTDKSGRLIHFERMILPFRGNGETVEHILSCFEFVCEDGAFDTTALIRMQSGAQTLRLCAMIDAPAVV